MNIDHDSHDEPVPLRPVTMAPPPASRAFRMSGDLAPLFAAKAQARLSFAPLVRDAHVRVVPQTGSPYEFEYATLASCRASCDRAFAENGLEIFHLWCDGPTEREQELHTFLTHSSGAFVEAVLTFRTEAEFQRKDGGTYTRPLRNQEIGSLLTYWERYSYVALAGIAAEADDDGNAADGNQVTERRDTGRAPTPKAQPAKEPKASAAKPEPKKSAGAPAADVAAPVTPERNRELLKNEIRQLMADMKMPTTELAVMCREMFHKAPNDCTDAEVEELITELRRIRETEGAAQ